MNPAHNEEHRLVAVLCVGSEEQSNIQTYALCLFFRKPVRMCTTHIRKSTLPAPVYLQTSASPKTFV
eukprot:9285372-Prorocentrum_lima.AAC.1